MTQNDEKLPEPERSSFTGKSGCDGGNAVVVVSRVRNGSTAVVGSWAMSALSRKAKKSISGGIEGFLTKKKRELHGDVRERAA